MGEENNHSPTEGPYDSALRELTELTESIAAQFEAIERGMAAIIIDVPKCESSKIVTADSAICEEEYPQHNITIQKKDGLGFTLDVCTSCLIQIMHQHKELNE